MGNMYMYIMYVTYMIYVWHESRKRTVRWDEEVWRGEGEQESVVGTGKEDKICRLSYVESRY